MSCSFFTGAVSVTRTFGVEQTIAGIADTVLQALNLLHQETGQCRDLQVEITERAYNLLKTPPSKGSTQGCSSSSQMRPGTTGGTERPELCFFLKAKEDGAVVLMIETLDVWDSCQEGPLPAFWVRLRND